MHDQTKVVIRLFIDDRHDRHKMAAARASLRKPSTRLGSDTSFTIQLQVRMINPPTLPHPIPTYQTSTVFQWRSQPDNLVMRYANFKSLLISLENDCFYGL